MEEVIAVVVEVAIIRHPHPLITRIVVEVGIVVLEIAIEPPIEIAMELAIEDGVAWVECLLDWPWQD